MMENPGRESAKDNDHLSDLISYIARKTKIQEQIP